MQRHESLSRHELKHDTVARQDPVSEYDYILPNRAGFEAGAAVRDITPPAGIDLTGFVARMGPNTGVLDRIWAKALVLRWEEAGARRGAAIVALDVLGLSDESLRTLRGRIERATGIPGNSVLFCASHTHAGPATQHLRHCGEVDPRYLEAFHGAVVEAVTEAAGRTVPARVAWASRVAESLDPHVINRRVRGGPRDLRLVGGLIERAEDGAPVAAVLRFTCHPVALGSANRLVSRDWPGYACDAVEAFLGGAPVLYLNGPAGNINPVGERGVESSKRVGEAVGREALALFEELRRAAAVRGASAEGAVSQAVTEHGAAGLDIAEQIAAPGEAAQGGPAPVSASGVAASSVAASAVEAPSVAVAGIAVDLPFEAVPEAGVLEELIERHRRRAAEIEQADAARVWEANAERVVAEWAEDALRAGLAGKVPPPCPAEVQAVRLGDVTLVGLPGESFVEIGAELVRTFGAGVVPLGYTNCNVGYIPWPDAYSQGGYEVAVAYRYYGYPAAFAPEASGNVVAAACEAVRAVGGGRLRSHGA